jgi:serine/threonine-protein kinase haspin
MSEASQGQTRSGKLPMDNPTHGVQVTIIDLGFARMDSGNISGLKTLWTLPDDEMFEGEGKSL